ncbi:MAG: ABC transporter transmembrane domain-containing protein, partial [Acidimicrobiales bacterium]
MSDGSRRLDASLLTAYLRPERARLLVLGVVLLVATLAPVAGPVLLGHAIDAALSHRPTGDLVAIAVAFLVVTVGADALQVLVAWQSVHLAWRVGNKLRLDLARHALRLDLDW